MSRFPAVNNIVKVEMYCDSADDPGLDWRDLTSDVLWENKVVISQGRPNESSDTPPASCSFALRDLNGDYSRRNPNSPYYGLLNQGTLLRVRTQCEYEDFSTTASNSWGTAPEGGAWTHFVSGNVPSPTDADFDKGSGIGTVVIPAATNVRTAYLANSIHADVDVQITFSTAVAASSAALYPACLVVRGQSSTDYIFARVRQEVSGFYNLNLRSAADGPIMLALVPNATYASGREFHVRLMAYGTFYGAKMWQVGTHEPLEWVAYGALASRGKYSGWVGVLTSSEGTNTNTNVVVSYKNFIVRSPRFIGEIASFKSNRDVSGNFNSIEVEASGVLRRIGQGEEPEFSAMRRGSLSVAGLIAYWPLEDGESATAFSSAISNGYNTVALEDSLPLEFQSTQLPNLASNTDIISSKALPSYNQAAFGAVLPNYTTTGSFALRFVLKIPAAGDVTNSVIARVWGSGTARLWQILYTTGGNLVIEAYDTNVANLFSTSVPFALNGENGRVSMNLVQNGANIDWQLAYYEQFATAIAASSGTLNSRTLGKQTYVDFNPFNTLTSTVIGHITAQSSFDNFNDINNQFNAYKSERAGDRIDRLCFENGVNILDDIIWDADRSTNAKMGPQLPDRFVPLLREAAATDMGTLRDARAMDLPRLMYRSLKSTYNQDPMLTLSMSSGEVAPSWVPTDDDQLIRNDITATSSSGGSYRATLNTGPMSILPAYDGGVGKYASDYPVNVEKDAQLADIASWQLALGTVDEYRFPTLTVNLGSTGIIASGKQNACLDVDVDDYVKVMDTDAEFIYEDIRQLARGYTEIMSSTEHIISYHCSPEVPYEGVILDDGLGFIDDDTTELNFAIDTTQTTIKVVSSTATWSTSASSGDLLIGGERMSSTGASSLTGGSFIAVGTAATANNSPVSPGLPTGHTTDDLLLMLTSSRSAGVSVTDGWTLIANGSGSGVQLRIYGKYDSGAESAPTVTPTNVANSDVAAQIACFRDVSLGLDWTDNGFTSQANGSAQNMAFLGQPTTPNHPQLVVCAAAKQDDWTSVATRTGATELAEIISTAGDDMGVVWDYQFCDGGATGSRGEDWTVTGGVSAISRTLGVALNCIQTITVGRSDNGVVKSHPAGTSVHVADPARLVL